MFSTTIPVFAKAIVHNGTQSVKIWSSSESIITPSPTLPYFFRKNPLGKHKLYSLATRQFEQYDRVEFKTVEAYKDYTERFTGFIQPTRDYINLINQHDLEFFKQWPSKQLKVMTFDIEQLSDGTKFPDVMDPVISIAWSINDGPIQQVHCEPNGADFNAIMAFATMLREEDPDIIVGYNHCKYDVPVITAKFKAYNIPASIWGREDREPFAYTKEVGPNELQCLSVPGRIMFDVYHSALTDQSLNGESRGLKNVARFYAKDLGIKEVKEIDRANNADLVGTNELAEYNKSDVNATRALFKNYFKNNLAVAEFVGAPLNKVVPLASTYGFSQILGNLFIKDDILADSCNRDRYPWAFEGLKEYIDEDGEKQMEKPFQGALVDVYKKGLFRDFAEFDVASLYPVVMAATGIGPDNTRILRVEPFPRNSVPPKLKIIRDDDVKTYYLPDTMRSWVWVIEVTGRSKVAEKIKAFLKQRLEIKKQSKVMDSAALYSIAYSLKVTLNSAYGLSGSEKIPYGELGVAVITTILGRTILQEGINFMGEENVALVDTDALKGEAKGMKSLKALSDHFNSFMVEVLDAEPLVVWEEDIYEAIWILKMKNYLTLKRKKDGSLEFKKHGACFKGTKLTNLYNKIIDTIGYTLLTEGHDAAFQKAKLAYNLAQYEKKDFIMNTRLGRKLEDYSNQDALQPSVARMAQKQGHPIYVGVFLQYIKTSNGYSLPNEESFKRLDKVYYRSIITDALARLGIERANEIKLDQWGI